MMPRNVDARSVIEVIDKEKERNEIVFGRDLTTAEKMERSQTRYFKKMEKNSLEQLVAKGYISLEDYHSGSLTVGKYLGFANFFEKRVSPSSNWELTFHGFVQPARIVIEGLTIEGENLFSCEEIIKEFVDSFRDASDFEFQNNLLHCWYD